MIFKHSGTFGDLIYSLSVVKKLGGGTMAVAMNNIETCVAQYGYRPDEVDPAHKNKFRLLSVYILPWKKYYAPHNAHEVRIIYRQQNSLWEFPHDSDESQLIFLYSPKHHLVNRAQSQNDSR